MEMIKFLALISIRETMRPLRVPFMKVAETQNWYRMATHLVILPYFSSMKFIFTLIDCIAICVINFLTIIIRN